LLHRLETRAGRPLRQTENRLADFAGRAGKRLVKTKETSGIQAGDPVRAAQAMMTLARGADAPRHLVLGTWGFNAVVAQLQRQIQDSADQRDVSLSADFDDGALEVSLTLRRDL
jgi:hypothetical protein